MTTNKFTAAVPLLAAAIWLPFAQAAPKPTHTWALVDEARQTLKDIEVTSQAAENEAAQLKNIVAHPRVSPESCWPRLMALKNDVNKMGRELRTLEAERHALPDWEQKAIERILPLLQATAANTQGAIEYYNENRAHLWTGSNRGYADRIYQESKQVAAILARYLKYDKLNAEEQRLNQELSTRGPTSGL